MGELRDRMEADLVLAGKAASTRRKYLKYARDLAAWHRRPPEELGEAEVRAFLLHLLNERKVSPPYYVHYLAGIKFLYKVTLRRPEVVAAIPFPTLERRPPEIPTPEEVSRLLRAAPEPRWRTLFLTAYACGLRGSEVVHLRSEDIDSRSMLVHVRHAKFGRARVVMLSERLLAELRGHWRREHLPGPWLFPARSRGGHGWSDQAVTRTQASDTFRRTLRAVGIARALTLHGLRHGFATHLIEAGVDSAVIKKLLGHRHLQMTMHYASVRLDLVRRTPSPIDLPTFPFESLAP